MPGAIPPATGVVKNASSTWLNGRPLLADLTRRLHRRIRLELPQGVRRPAAREALQRLAACLHQHDYQPRKRLLDQHRTRPLRNEAEAQRSMTRVRGGSP